MKIKTMEDLRKHKPCYDPARYLPENWQGTAVDLLRLDACPAKNRIWMVTRLGLFFTDKQLRLFACDCAERALKLIKTPDERSVDAVKIAKRYAEGKATKDELKAAAAYAYAAADAAAAAYAAGYAADAADAATYEREVQIQELIKLAETGETRSVTKHKEAT